MIESGCLSSDLPDLDRTDDPRGGAAAWALLAVGVTVVTVLCMATLCGLGVG
jgi:hypothetical protein